MVCLNLTLIILILISFYDILSCAESTEGFSSLLNYTNFQVNSRLILIDERSAKLWESSITESYSNKYNKARLDFHSESTTGRIQYFYDDFDKGRLVKKEYGPWCNLAYDYDFVHDLFGTASSAFGFLNGVQWFIKRHGIPDHVIGLARLIIILQANKDKHIFDSTEGVVVNKQETIKYKLEDDFYTGIKIFAYYSKSSALWTDNDVPLRIEINLNESARLLVDYSMIKPIGLLGLVEEDESLNFFAFPVGFACSRTMQSFDLFRGSESHKVVSFKAEIKTHDSENQPRKLFVAYDGYLDTMRMETMTREDRFPNSILSASKTIFNFGNNIKYNYVENPSSNEMECVAAEIISDRSEVDPYDAVLSFKRLVHMGTAVIRGVRAEVFEKLTFSLPTLFFPKVSFKDTNGKYYTSYGSNSQYSSTGPSELVLIYYFSASINTDNNPILQILDKPLGPLMRIEVFEREQLIHTVEIYEFLWYLSRAPDGEPEEMLFRLDSSCAVSGLAARPSLTLELEYDMGKQETLSSRSLRILGNQKSRNEGSIRALILGSNFTAIQIFDWTSRFTLLNERSSILYVNARLVQPLDYYYEAVQVGRGAPTTLVEEEKTNMNYEECFWKALHTREKSVHLLFSYCDNKCIIDLNPKLSYNTKAGEHIYESSNKFQFSSSVKWECQILRIDRRIIGSSSVIPELYWSREFESLRAKTLYLPVPNQTQKDEEFCSMDVKRLELFNEKWSASETADSGKRTGSKSLDLAGLGLLPDIATRVVLDEQYPSTLTSNKLIELTTMDYEFCHANCLANISCNSFSLCLNRQHQNQVECLVSELNFHESNVIEKISNLPESDLRWKTGTLEIVFANQTQDEENDNPREPRRVKLRLDRRCHIYHKNPLELFKTPSIITNASRNKKHLINVNNEEECANKCLSRNIKLIRQSSESYLRHLSDGNENLKRMLEKNNKNRWCNHFDYINFATSNLNNPTTFSSQLNLVNKKDLCILPEVGGLTGNGMIKFTLRSYDFRYSSLYKKQYGYKLRPFTPNITNEDINNNVGNTQIVMREFDVENCARACFEQTVDMKLPCKSFDVLQIISNDIDNGDEIRVFNCFFNSLTSKEARNSNNAEHLVDEKIYNITFIHYEPIYSKEGLSSKRMIEPKINEEVYVTVSKIGILLILCLSLISGLSLGVYLSENISNWVNMKQKTATDRSSTFIKSMAGVSEQTDISHFRFD